MSVSEGKPLFEVTTLENTLNALSFSSEILEFDLIASVISVGTLLILSATKTMSSHTSQRIGYSNFFQP